MVTPMTKTDIKTETDADKIWNEIKSLPIAMYALPGQTVEQYLVRVDSNIPELMVKISASAVVPALEMAFNGRYTMDQMEGYFVIRRAPEKLVIKDPSRKSRK
jgi:hypothetical protein